MFVSVRTLEAARAQAIATARTDFERTLAVLREENSTLRRMLEAASQRADGLALEIAKSMVIQATPPPQPVEVKRTSRDPIAGLGSIFDPVAHDHPEATFTDARAASLMAAEEDDDGVSDAA